VRKINKMFNKKRKKQLTLIGKRPEEETQ
jgi:hypothetical protein